jgi:hypothetical protein
MTSASIPILMAENNFMSIKSGKFLMCGFGVGYSWGSAIIDFDKINSIAVNVGILDKLFGKNSGTILLDSGKLTTTKDIDGKYSTKTDFHKLQFIDDAYNVYEKLNKVSTETSKFETVLMNSLLNSKNINSSIIENGKVLYQKIIKQN